jgi:hypothetical protein
VDGGVVPPDWSFEHSIQCDVTPEFAWDFWTDVQHWALDADVDSIEIDGPFAAGTHGVTQSKSSGRLEWRIGEAQSGRAVIEFPLPGAVGRFEWTFEKATPGTRITQRCLLEGDRAGAYAKDFGPILQAGIPEGMRKLADAMERASRKP